MIRQMQMPKWCGALVGCLMLMGFGLSNTVHAATLSFAAKVDYGAGNTPFGLASGDITGDGKRDLIVTDNGSNTISFYPNNGNGTFGSKVDLTVGNNPTGVTTADFNGDGQTDIAVANKGSNTMSVITVTVTGNGVFFAKRDYSASSGPRFVTSGDFNGDGKPDLVVANYDVASVSVFLNNGNGTFATKVDYGVGNVPVWVTSGDFNGDGKLDLAVANSGTLGGGNNVSVLIGTGTGTFVTKVDYPTAINPVSVTSGDFNGDGKLDLAVANQGSNTVSVLMGTGTGTFAAKVDYGTGTQPTAVASGDFNGDGKLDLAASNFGSSSVSVLLGTGSGSFGAKTDLTSGTNPNYLMSADFNADGKPDLATANNVHTVSVLLNTAVLPSLAITSAVTANEGDSGTTAFTFTVTRSGDTSAVSSVAYSVGGGTATASDYGTAFDSDGGIAGSNGGTPGTLNFAAGVLSGTITVPIVGDQGLETNETFNVTLSNAANGAITTATGIGTILNDDSGLVVTTISDTTNGSDNDNTLREAVATANTLSSADTVSFNIAGAGVQTIQLRSTITLSGANTTIDGYTQSGASANTNASPAATNAVLKIEVKGTGTIAFDGLTVNGAGCTIKGLSIGNCGNGIYLTGAGATGTVISGNYLGTKADGATPLGNYHGVLIQGAASNTIGGTSAGARNVISGNSGVGVWITGSSAPGNTVSGNYIGTKADGATALANGDAGVYIVSASSNTIGGTSVGARNVISGNSYNVYIRDTSSGNTVSGNYIGTKADGATALANSYGVTIDSAASNTIGGTSVGARNVISGNSNVGVFISGSAATGNTVSGNYIGTKADGATALPNGNGVVISSAANTIGGTSAAACNVISGNAFMGIFIGSSARGNSVCGNSIHDNGGLGIDLFGAEGVTANDSADGDSGANSLQNYPVLSTITSSGGNTTITGTLNSNAGQSYVLDFYDNDVADPSGYGEGQTYLGSTKTDVMADGTDKAFTATLTGVTLTDGHYITATATRTSATDASGALGDTSEFSAAITENQAPVNSVPGTQTTNEDTTRVFSTANGNAIQTSDAGASSNPVKVSLHSTNGSVTLSGTSGLTFTSGANSSPDMTFTGTIAAINTSLAGLSYAPFANINGTGTLTITTNDLGNTGTGGALQDVDTVSITITPVNDNPIANADAGTVALGAIQTLDVLGNDSSAPDVGETLTIQSVSAVTGGGTATIVNNKISYTAPASGTSASFTYTLSDGNGGTATATVTMALAAASAAAAAPITVTQGGIVRGSTLTRYRQTITLTNVGAVAVTGTFYIVFGNLNVTLVNAEGTSVNAPTNGPFVTLTGTLQPGSPVSIIVDYENPGRARISYTPSVRISPGTP